MAARNNVIFVDDSFGHAGMDVAPGGGFGAPHVGLHAWNDASDGDVGELDALFVLCFEYAEIFEGVL